MIRLTFHRSECTIANGLPDASHNRQIAGSKADLRTDSPGLDTTSHYWANSLRLGLDNTFHWCDRRRGIGSPIRLIDLQVSSYSLSFGRALHLFNSTSPLMGTLKHNEEAVGSAVYPSTTSVLLIRYVVALQLKEITCG